MQADVSAAERRQLSTHLNLAHAYLRLHAAACGGSGGHAPGGHAHTALGHASAGDEAHKHMPRALDDEHRYAHRALEHAHKAVEMDPCSAKALFRRAQAVRGRPLLS